jgi:excisionase family DNA binding protein
MVGTETEDILLDATEVARWLGVAVTTVYEQAAREVIPHIRLWKGSRRTLIRFKRVDIEQFLQARAVAVSRTTR